VDIRKEPFVNESVDWQGVFSRQFLALPPGIFYGGISRLVAVELKDLTARLIECIPGSANVLRRSIASR